MQAILKFDVNSFDIPYYVKIKPPYVPGHDLKEISIPVHMLTDDVLDRLCNDFTKRLFDKVSADRATDLQRENARLQKHADI